ncbi:MAG: Uma2 family endonuclease [Chloroflexota bacterium]
MTLTLNRAKKEDRLVVDDRPGWIPDHIHSDWDPSPYAYQTEEEMMPAGGPHSRKLNYIAEVLRHPLEDKNLMFITDTFLLYRDKNNIKQRIAPDFLLLDYREEAPSAYDLDIEPVPKLIIELTSPDSISRDLNEKNRFYLEELGITTYLVIDAITPQGHHRSQIRLYLWRLEGGQMWKIDSDLDGGYLLPEIGIRLYAEGQQLRFIDVEASKNLLDSGELTLSLNQTQQALGATQQALDATQQTLQDKEEQLDETQSTLAAERQARVEAEAELARLRQLLKEKNDE